MESNKTRVVDSIVTTMSPTVNPTLRNAKGSLLQPFKTINKLGSRSRRLERQPISCYHKANVQEVKKIVRIFEDSFRVLPFNEY